MQSSPGSGANPTQRPSPGQGRMNNRSEEVNQQARYITKQQPEDQNDRPEVDPIVMSSPRYPEIPWMDDETFTEESLDEEEAQLERPESSARMTGIPVKEASKDTVNSLEQGPSLNAFGDEMMTDPPGSITSSLYVVCYHCMDLGCIKPTGSCNEPSHHYNKDYFIDRDGVYPIRKVSSLSNLHWLCRHGFQCKSGWQCKYAHCEEELAYWKDPSVLPPLEVCKRCRWEHCNRLLQSQCCSHSGKDKVEAVVYIDQSQKEVVGIRCPINLRMQNKEYQCNHSLNAYESMHISERTCDFPHSKVEEDVWKVWEKTNSTNVLSRTANQFCEEIKEAYRNLVQRQEAGLPVCASHAQESPFSVRRPAHPSRQLTRPFQPMTRKVFNRELLDSTLTTVNYKDKFLHLNELEMQEHEQVLERYNGTFPFEESEYPCSDKWPRKHMWYGSLEVSQSLGDYVRQAAAQVELKKEGGGWTLTGDIVCTRKFPSDKYILLVGFNEMPRGMFQQAGCYSSSQLRVVATFFLKYRYFQSLQNAIEQLPDAVILKLVPECPPQSLNDNVSHYLGMFPGDFQLDDEHQGKVCQKLLRASSDLPFLITGPFGAGKTRVIVAAVFSILKSLPQSHILIATHHQKTADEYVESYFTEDLVKREGLEVVRLVSKDTPLAKITGLKKYLEMVNDNLGNFQLIITTFIASMGLSPRLKEGHFSHIFIDSAAQAREPETIAALRLAGQETKIIIAGDHMQVGPNTSVLGKVPREKGLSVSLLVRLHKLYRKMSITSHHSQLLVNYRSVPNIVRLPNQLFYKCRLQTRADSLCHPDWDKVVYFVCSSLDTDELAADGKKFCKEAELEVEVMVQLVQKYVGKKRKSKSRSPPNANLAVVGKVDPSSVCVMFPTRFTENLWRRAVRDSPKLRKVTSTVAYDIQGREFEAVFVCTAEPVNQDYSPSDPVKSMCDRYMFNTVITRPKSLLVAIGNPFRLHKIEKSLEESLTCWSEYIYQCWEGDSLLLSATLREDLGACKKQLDKLKELMFQTATSKLHISPQAKEEGKNWDEDAILQDYRKEQSSGWKLGEVTRVEVEVMGKQESLLCKLDGHRAIPKDPHLEPFIIPTVDNRRCAFDGAVVQVKEVGRTEDGRTGKVVNVEKQGAVDPIICTVDSLNPLILVPVSGKNPKMVNQPEGTETDGEIKQAEAMVKYYRPECLTHSVDAIPYKAAVDVFFVVQPLEWSVKERYPIGAVVGVLPKRPPLQLAEKILAIQHKLPTPSNWSMTTASTKADTLPLPKSHIQFKTAIGIRDPAGRCTCCFSVETEKNYFTVAVHICNIMELVSKMEEYKERKFSEWFTSHLVLPHSVVQASNFSEDSIQKAITVVFKVEGPVRTAEITQKDMLTAQLSITLMSIQETVAQCSTMLNMSEVERVLLLLQKGHIGDRKLKRRTLVSYIDALAILYGTAEYHHKIRLGHGGYPILELASYNFPETEKMVNELLTMANSEAAKRIANVFPDQALLVNQEANHNKEQSNNEIFPSLAVLPAIYPMLNLQGPATPKPAQAWIVSADKMKALVEALKNADFLKVRQLLYFLPCYPWITPLEEASGNALTPEQFTVGCSQSAGKAPTHCLRHVPYTSFTDPLRCVGDIYVQEQLLAALRNKKLSMTTKDVHHIAMNCNKARLNAKGYESSVAKLHWAYFAQSSLICVQSVVKSVERGKLHLCYQYGYQNNVQKKFVAQASMTFHHSTYSAKVTTLSGTCQVGTRSGYQVDSEGRIEQGYASHSMLTAPKTVLVPTETIFTVVECINSFAEEKVARALESLQKLLKQEHPSSTQSRAPAEPKLQDAHFVLLEFPLNLSSYQLVDVWMRVDYSQCIAKLEPALLDMAHNVRVCLHHTEQPEACFTSGAVMVPHQVQLSVESYVRKWGEVLLAEAACRSVKRQQHILINDVLIQFTMFEALDVVGSEEFYRPVGEVTMVLPKVFVENRQDIFPIEQGDLVCARYEVNLSEEEEEEARLELLERHGNYFPPDHKPVGRLVLHMVVEGMQQEVMMSQEVVQPGLQVYLRVVGEQGTHLSPLMRDLLVANKHTCQVEVVPMEPGLRRVHQCLQGMDRLVEPSKLGKDIIFGNHSRPKTAQVSDCPSLAEMEKEYPKLTHVWKKLGQESLNDSQRSAFQKAYHGMFHIIQGPPGTGKLEVAVHLAYAFAQKNRLNEVMMTDMKQPCVLLCAPSDTAVDTALSHLKFAAGLGDKDIRLLRIYSREVERKHCPGPYQDTNVFEETATADYSIPQGVEKFALHHLTSSKLALPAELEKIIQYSNVELPPADQPSKYRRLLAEAERQVIQEGKFDVVLCTCSEAGSARFQRHFTPFQCIVYEASLASEPETVAAISQSCHQVVLIGDHSSVGPPVWSKVARLAGLGVSLFERYARQLINEEDEYSKQLYSFLDEQSRMVVPLCEFPSQEFYNGQLKTCSKIEPRMLTSLDFLWPTGSRQPIVFCNVSGTEETDHATFKSAEDATFNRTEAEKVVDIVQRIVAVIGKESANTKDFLAVLTTTEAQKSLIKNLLQLSKMDKTLKGDVLSQVTTFSASQGITANLVILSTVRSCPTGALPNDRTALLDHQWKEEHLGLLCQPHHTCQALTTGKHGLVIVGDKNLLCHNDTWRHLVEHCNEKRCFVDGDAFPPPWSKSPSPMPESRFHSDFESHRKLGKGTFGVVYCCQNRVDHRCYAVKCIKLPCKENDREKVMREAKALAQLDHLHIVRYYGAWVEKGWEGCLLADEEDESCSNSSLSATPTSSKSSFNSASLPSATSTSHSSYGGTFVYGRSLAFLGEGTSGNKSDAETENCQDFGTSSTPTGGATGEVAPPEHLFIQMELCCEDSLQSWLRTNVETRSQSVVLQYFEQILDAVSYVHQKGMMHRDLKPSNIFFSVDDSNKIKIGDFGLVTGVLDSFPFSPSTSSRRSELDTPKNRKGRTHSIGTAPYSSPEQKNGMDYDQKVDVYSLGVIFYEMNHPFTTGMERAKVLEKVNSGIFPGKFKELHPTEVEMVKWMLSPDPTNRPSAEQVASSAILKRIKDGMQGTRPMPPTAVGRIA